MATSTNALSWVLERTGLLGFKSEALDWIKPIFKGYTDVHVEMTVDGITVHGWGAAADDDLALLKAISECIERLVVLKSKSKTSSGFASHLNVPEAEKNGASELIERDLFMCHFLGKTPLIDRDSFFTESRNISNARQWAQQNDLDLHFGGIGACGIVCAIGGYRANHAFGVRFGACYGNNLVDTAEKAFIEAARYVARQLLHRPNHHLMTLEKFYKLPTCTFSDHGQLALNPDYAKLTEFLFKDLSPEQRIYEPDLSDISFSYFETVPFLGVGCPFKVARAESNSVQQLWKGVPNQETVNLTRVSEAFRKPVYLGDLNLLPHPFD